MSWQLLVPIAEKLIDAGVDYYKSANVVQGSVATTEKVGSQDKGATLLLVVEPSDSTTKLTEEILKKALEAMAESISATITSVTIQVNEDIDATKSTSE